MNENENENEEEMFFSIVNMKEYCNSIVDTIAQEMKIDLKNEILEFVSLKQIEGIVNENCIEHNEENQPIINVESHIKILDDVYTIVQSTALSQLAADGYLECAWDEEINDMIFWLKDQG